jgi:polar amino acid transport system permease protein
MGLRLLIQFSLAIGFLFTIFFLVSVDQKLQWESVWVYRQLFFQGWVVTVLLSLASLVLSLFVGLLTVSLKRSEFHIANLAAKFYIEIVRGTPLLVQILFFYYVVAHHIGLDNRYVAGVIILSIFNGAYIAEIIRG